MLIHTLLHSAAFLIKCGSETNKFYWKEADQGKVTATTDKTDATRFSIDIDRDDPTLFAIRKFQEVDGPRRCLACKWHSWTPTLSETSRLNFYLQDPMEEEGKVNPHEWISNEKSWLYIRCPKLAFNKLCIKRQGDEHELTVVSGFRKHNNPPNVCMLFCLERDLKSDAG